MEKFQIQRVRQLKNQDDKEYGRKTKKVALIKCQECGKEISDKTEKCPHCGYPINSYSQRNYYDTPSVGSNILAFIIPIAGLILYFANLSLYPQKASSIGKCALIGFVFGLIVLLLL